MIDPTLIERVHEQVRETLRSVARTGEPVLAEMAREVLTGHVSLRDAMSRPAYAEAVAQRIERSWRELDGQPEPAPAEPAPVPATRRPRDEADFFTDPLRHNKAREDRSATDTGEVAQRIERPTPEPDGRPEPAPAAPAPTTRPPQDEADFFTDPLRHNKAGRDRQTADTVQAPARQRWRRR